MKLVQICEPLFQCVCRVSRSMRKRAAVDVSAVRAEVEALLADIRGRCNQDPSLAGQWDEVERPLLFFVDHMMRSMPDIGDAWPEFSMELPEPEPAYEERFFDLLDETLADKSAAGTERVAVFYTCLGLGFTGWYTGQPELLRKKTLECASRLRRVIDSDESQICPEAYQHVNTANLVQPPVAGVTGIVIALVGLTLAVFAAYVALYVGQSKQLSTSVETLAAGADAAPTNSPATQPGKPPSAR